MADRLISADDLVERAYRLRLDSRELIAQMIESAPTVDAEPVRHGHWEYHTRHQRDCVASCSVCRKRTTFFFKNGTKYCPFCGAKMDEEASE